MHLLKIIHGYPPTFNAGSEVYSQSICEALSRNHRVSVFTRDENPYAPEFAIRHQAVRPNLDLYFVNHPNGKDGYRHAAMDAAFGELVDRLQPDVAHIGHLNHLSTGLVDELKQRNIPILFTLHDFWLACPRGQFLTRSIGRECNNVPCSGQDHRKCATTCYSMYFSGREAHRREEEQQWTNWIAHRMEETRRVAQQAEHFVAPSKYLRQRFIEQFGLPEHKISYLDYGFSTEYLQPVSGQSPDRQFTFGYIGTHIPAKGVNHLLEAFADVETAAELIIFGREYGASTTALQAMAARCPNPVTFAGEYRNQDIVQEVFAKVDCIVVPSIWGENSPLVIHEAQACHIPVITANFGGMKEYVQHQVNGLLFEHRNSAALAEQLNWAVNNRTAMHIMGRRGYLHSESGQVPDIDTHVAELEKHYERLLATKNLWRVTIDTNPEDCNLKCIMCEEHSPYSDFIPILYKETGIKRRRMSMETVESIFEQAEQLGIREIIPSTMGEPLLYKGIERIFELAQEHGIKINLTTNGTFPKHSVEEWAAWIVPNTTDIKISWNGATAETAEKIMTGLDFETVVGNVQRLVHWRNKHREQTGWFCRITFQLTFMQNNVRELAEIVELAASLGVDRVKGHQLWAHFDEIKSLSMRESAASIATWNEAVEAAHCAGEQHRKPNGEAVLLEYIIPIEAPNGSPVPEHYECPFLGKELWVSATGKISPCCAPDKQRQALGDFGNIADQSLAEVMTSPIYRELVINYKNKPLCKTCNMRKPE